MIKIIFCIIYITCLNAVSVVNGEFATKEHFSSAVYIWSLKANKVQFRCSGTIIAPDVVITETTCIYDQQNIKRGDTFLISNSTNYDTKKPLATLLESVIANVRSDIKHPTENLILLYLNQAVPIEPAVLLQTNEIDQLISTDIATIIGWGFHEQLNKKHWLINSINYLLNENDSRQLGTKHVGISHLGSQSNRFIELGYEPNDAFGCTGDEGGPIFISLTSENDLKNRLVGIISSHNNLAKCTSPTYGLRLDKFANFIQKELEQACSKGIRTWCDIKGLIPPEFNDNIILDLVQNLKTSPEPDNHNSYNEDRNPPPDFTGFTKKDDVPSTPSDDNFEHSTKSNGSIPKKPKIKMAPLGCSCSQTYVR
ncbi:MAG: trypsin-like serine protease [bacterium]|nr:trypsin-like serine protease [bacterium]